MVTTESTLAQRGDQGSVDRAVEPSAVLHPVGRCWDDAPARAVSVLLEAARQRSVRAVVTMTSASARTIPLALSKCRRLQRS